MLSWDRRLCLSRFLCTQIYYLEDSWGRVTWYHIWERLARGASLGTRLTNRGTFRANTLGKNLHACCSYTAASSQVTLLRNFMKMSEIRAGGIIIIILVFSCGLILICVCLGFGKSLGCSLSINSRWPIEQFLIFFSFYCPISIDIPENLWISSFAFTIAE